jgi:hypothetical protein
MWGLYTVGKVVAAFPLTFILFMEFTVLIMMLLVCTYLTIWTIMYIFIQNVTKMCMPGTL